jgi:alkanesulfonate monooxygenase SsuD/methylene tetrahydromethanopterin reductase-like flavin-dependent oxidoreductase (luciferase family)
VRSPRRSLPARQPVRRLSGRYGRRVRFGIHLPIFEPYGEPATLVDLAVLAERSGWDGVFVWDHLWFPGSPATADPWIALAAIASATSSVTLGPLVTPLARRRPWKLARETATLDRLSSGRLVLGVGLGVPRDYELFGEPVDGRARGDATDEAIELLRAFWSERTVEHAGARFTVRAEGDEQPAFRPGPHGGRAIPLWAAARLGSPERPFRRAAGLDGVAPVPASSDPASAVTADQLAEVVERVARHRPSLDGFEVVAIASSAGGESPSAYERAGATWFVEDLHPRWGGLERAREIVAAGPPR